MTKKELSVNIIWDEFEIGTCRLFIESLQAYIPVLFFQDHKPNPTISDTMLQAVNEILCMKRAEFESLKQLLQVENHSIKEIHIDQDNDIYAGVYSEFIIDTGEDLSKTVIVKNGKFIAINEGNYFDTLDREEIKHRNKHLSTIEREKIIALMRSE